ncbi:MAG: SLBB domain-containing protein [Candidatus Aegiribacteria sp.]|nr:SLBB domain-containing protein [Candidatus Aegiribacteria sp.]
MWIINLLLILSTATTSTTTTSSAISPYASIIGENYGVSGVDRDEYTIGSGDVFTVVFEGGGTESLIVAGVLPFSYFTVSGDGFASISGVGSVEVTDLSINEAQYLIQALVSEYYPSARVSISLDTPRFKLVGVHGFVNYPNEYTVPATFRVSNLISIAGQVAFNGSQYSIVYTESGDSLLSNLTINKTGTFTYDPMIYNALSIEVILCDNPVYIFWTSGVRKTWDIGLDGISVKNIIEQIGGITGAVNISASFVRREEGNEFIIYHDSSGYTDQYMFPGDTLVFVNYAREIAVSGAVTNPGLIPYRFNQNVSKYLMHAGGILQDASLAGTYVIRGGENISVSEDELNSYIVVPNDAIYVPYNWYSRNRDMITLLTTAVALTISVSTFLK